MSIKFTVHCLKFYFPTISGMAAVDSSAPETTSSDNSPTVVRRPFAKHNMGGAGSDSESSGRSSDSVGSGSAIPRLNRPRNSDSPSLRYQYSLEPRSMKNHNFRWVVTCVCLTILSSTRAWILCISQCFWFLYGSLRRSPVFVIYLKQIWTSTI